MGREGRKKITIAGKHVIDPREAARDHQCCRGSIVCGHAAHRERFFNVLGVAVHCIQTCRLFCRI